MYRPNFTDPSVLFSSTIQCAFCGMWHTGKCSLVKKIEYHQDGTVKSIEFFEKIHPANVKE